MYDRVLRRTIKLQDISGVETEFAKKYLEVSRMVLNQWICLKKVKKRTI